MIATGSFNGSFRELFRLAERIENPSLAEGNRIVVVQPFLDEVETDHDNYRRKRKIKTLEPDEDKLIKIALNIVDPDLNRRINNNFKPKSSNNNINYQIKKMYNKADLARIRLSETMQPPIASSIPRLNWEQEVRLVMENHDTATLTKLLSKTCLFDPHTTLIFPPQKLNTEIAPFYCFEPNYVDANEVFDPSSDPLNRIIPNPTEDQQAGVTLDQLLKKSRAHSNRFKQDNGTYYYV